MIKWTETSLIKRLELELKKEWLVEFDHKSEQGVV